MLSDLPLFPEQASAIAGRVDALFFFLISVALFFSILIAGLLTYFAVKYRRRSEEIPEPTHASLKLELIWTIIPLLLSMVMFVWGTSVFFSISHPPQNAMEVYVVGKRWMWKLQHMDGQREINELHIPVGRPVKLVMASEDVIHSFYVPAFRVKKDVLPGRYSTEWFEATKTGKYHLFCAEYCGTKHSGMVGWVTVMEPAEFQNWLSGGTSGMSPVAAGEKLFQQLSCQTCHRSDLTERGPSLAGLFGREVHLQGGRTVKADESYLRESIVNPNAKIVTGYQQIMPTYQGLITEEGLLQLIAYIKSMASPAGQNAETPRRGVSAGTTQK